MHGLGEGAEVEADDGFFEPGSGGGNDFGVGGHSVPPEKKVMDRINRIFCRINRKKQNQQDWFSLILRNPVNPVQEV
ncbi:hypothetical protein TPL01_05820 [Sulfuriferula plumbiphila]|uniref:Uncharacterized protein n=1 Tax=Sulfuriferula plumbiphila TaxID=171865 RepID=A0A512L4R0_9PROT|nr:hypothetical protein SFPGR_05790 [Sulfuriferula plumbiphila]GEP29444.1 hypothetical protein TPL01_05820 [Sulfuriferula plumbiphila]